MTDIHSKVARAAKDRLAFDLLRLLRPDLRQLFPMDSAEGVWAWLGWMATSGAAEYAQLRENGELRRLLGKPAPQPGLTAVEWAIYLSRHDVRRHIPPNATASIKRWYREHAIREHGLEYLADEDTDARKNESAPRPLGVNVIGHATGELGIGEDCRMAAQALAACGVPHCVVNFAAGSDVSTRVDDGTLPLSQSPIYCVNLFCLTAMETARCYLEWGDAAFGDFYNIGYWPWELRDWPAQWESMLRLVDEVWVSSRHIHDAVSPVSDKPVLIMPMAVQTGEVSSRQRRDFGLPEDHTLFCFSFDFNSSTRRKNPDGVIEAFLRAFPDAQRQRDVGLVIKSHHSTNHSTELAALKALASRDARVHLIDATLAKADVLALYAACDCFVSLHRAEGFGRGIAEALLLGTHVITTNYSGNLEFCGDRNCDLVDAAPLPTNADDYPFGDANGWSDPDLDQAAGYMKRLHQTGQRKTLTGNPFDARVVGERYKTRLRWIMRTRVRAPAPDQDMTR